MMSSTCYPSSYLNFTSAGHLLHPSTMDCYKGPLRGPGLLPYLGPLYNHGHLGVFQCPLEPAFIQKRNQRERHRVRCVNQGYARLRDHLPGQSADKRLSKVETLRAAIRYIKYLQGLMEQEDISGSPGPDFQGRTEGAQNEDSSSKRIQHEEITFRKTTRST